MVTFSNLIESRGRTDGVWGVLSEKMSKDFYSDGSEKNGESTGLRGGEIEEEGMEELSGGKFSKVQGRREGSISGLTEYKGGASDGRNTRPEIFMEVSG